MHVPVLKTVAALATLAALVLPAPAQATDARSQNILLVIADDLGVDKVGAYAADTDPTYASTAQYLPETPTIDLLAESGVRFTDAWANPACSPTRASLFTGRLPLRHGVGQAIGKSGSTSLGLDETTIAQVMADAGYATGLFGKWHLGDGETPSDWAEGESWDDHLGETVGVQYPPVALGWSKFQGTIADLDVGTWAGYYDYMEVVAVPRWGGWLVADASSEYATQATTQAALSWIEKQTGPWFATVSYHAPHTPFQPPPAGCGYNESAKTPSADAAVYKLMVECMDEQLGELLDSIAGLQNTVVIFVGDNGTDDKVAEGVFADGRGKGTLYETGVRVPLVVADGHDYLNTLGVSGLSSAGVWNSRVANPNRTSDDLVHVADLFATIGALGGGDTRSGDDAASLVPVLSDTGTFERGPIASEMYGASLGTLALRRGDYKLLVTATMAEGSACRSKYELFNVVDDRFEQTNLYHRSPTEAARMILSLDELAASAPGSWIDVPDCSES